MLLLLFALPAAHLDPAHPSEAALLTQLQALQPEPELERRANYDHFDAQLEAALERANKIECNVVLDSEPVPAEDEDTDVENDPKLAGTSPAFKKLVSKATRTKNLMDAAQAAYNDGKAGLLEWGCTRRCSPSRRRHSRS